MIYDKAKSKVKNFYGIVTIVVGVVTFYLVLFDALYDIGIVLFPTAVLVALRSKRSGSTYGLVGLIINLLGTIYVYGGIVMALVLPSLIY